jgi:hypothetical protein
VRKRERLREWLDAANVGRIDPSTRDRIAAHLAPVSASYLRKLLRESGVSLDPLVEGVRQDSLDHAERTLCALSEAYLHTPREARALVIEAKDHARLALRRDADAKARSLREELIEWMIVWVNDPALFPIWVRLRRARHHAELQS